MSTNARPSGLAAFIVGVALLVLPWTALLLLSLGRSTVSIELPSASIDADGGKGFITPIRPGRLLGGVRGFLYEFPADHAGGQQSGVRLFENDVELGPAHASHGDIREFGGGKFSHWDRNLYFSTKDGGDARDGARRYRIETPVEVSRAAGFVALALSGAGAVIAWMSPFARRRTAAWRARWLHGQAPRRETIAPLPRAWRAALVVLWIVCAGTAAWIGRGEHDPYLLSTVPTAGFGDHANALPGYSPVFFDGVPRHQENMQTWDHVAMFNGSRIAADMYANRPLYPFFVSCLAWLLGVGGACLAVNLMAWAIGAWAATRVGAEASGRFEGGVVAGALACLGPGWWFHVSDYSAHQLSFATSAVALLVILRSRVWAARQPAEVHAGVAGVLVLASLAYNSGLFFTAAYGLLAIWRNRWWHVLLTCVAAVGVQRAWTPLLNLLSGGTFDYYAVERQLFEGAMSTWPEWWRDGSWLGRSSDVFIDTLVSYAAVLPLIVLGALAPLLRGVRRDAKPPDGGSMLLLLLSIAMPIAATIVYSPTATARGYLVFGASTAVWSIAAILFARLRGGAWRGAAVGVLLLGLVVQGFLVTRHAGGDARGVKLYMWGQPTWNLKTIEALRTSAPTEVLGLAGEPAPRIGGGTLQMIEVGGFDGGRPFTTLPAFKNGLQFGQMVVVRGVLVLAIGGTIHLLLVSGLMSAPRRGRASAEAPLTGAAPVARGPKGVAVALAIVGVMILPPFFARLRDGGPEVLRHDLHDRALPRRAKVVTYEVDVDPAALARLERWAALGARVDDADEDASPGVRDGAGATIVEADLFTGFGWSDKAGEGVDVEVLAGATPVARFSTEGTGRRRRPIDLATLVDGLRREPRLRVIARRDDGINACASWQRGDLPGRVLRLDADAPVRAAEAPAPILEIRVFTDGRTYDPRLILY